MSALEQTVIDDLSERLTRYLIELGGYAPPVFLDAGGSAAVFKVESDKGTRAFKGFSPDLFSGPGGAAERRRLEVQRKLIGHGCGSLIQTYRAEEAEGTAFIEMEFVSWPQLTKVLAHVPDDAVVGLITQLVDAVRFLESLNIVHRDIKPENIHISEDFTKLKLLDLGVAREFELPDKDMAGVTDHGNKRPFLATAQYSSPEYLFRLDEPTNKLWRALNFYQMGAVLHDLIMKEPLFHHEMNLANRWLVARAVLAKTPTFTDPTPNRLIQLKALSARCLVKDMETRLRVVGWDDFILEGSKDPMTALRGRLTRGLPKAGNQASESAAARLDFDRTEFTKRFSEKVRSELLPICGTQLPLTVTQPAPGEPSVTKFLLTVNKQICIACHASIEWLEQLYERTANIKLSAELLVSGMGHKHGPAATKTVCTVTMNEAENESAISVCNAIAIAAETALDFIESTEDCTQLNGIDLQVKK